MAQYKLSLQRAADGTETVWHIITTVKFESDQRPGDLGAEVDALAEQLTAETAAVGRHTKE
jgi:hypothetical protein